MEKLSEKAIVYTCNGENIVGIQHSAFKPSSNIGAIIIVGGPQYRAGSHRLFVKIARYLAMKGIHSFRFDLRGMGDSSGKHPGFEFCKDDISCAIEIFIKHEPSLEKIVLIGLCDGAFSATLGISMQKVIGLCLINPWIINEQSEARAYIKHYYFHRIMNPEFWQKLFSFKINPMTTLMEIFQKWRTSKISPKDQSLEYQFHNRLSSSLVAILFLISSNDLTGQAFLEVSKDKYWASILKRDNVSLQIIRGADHTFSTQAHSDQLFAKLGDWITQITDLPSR